MPINLYIAKNCSPLYVRPALFVMALISGFVSTQALAGPCTWTGGGGGGDKNWSSPSNWTCVAGTIPINGGNLIFPSSAAQRESVNDLVGLSQSSIEVQSCGYVISGNPLTLSGNAPIALTCGTPSGFLSMTLPTTLTGVAPISITTLLQPALRGAASLGGPASSGPTPSKLTAAQLRIPNGGTTQFAIGPITTAQSLEFTQTNPTAGSVELALSFASAESVVLRGQVFAFNTANTISGVVSVRDGAVLLADDPNALGAIGAAAKTVVFTGSELSVSGPVSGESLELNHDVPSPNGPVFSGLAAVNGPTWSGPISLSGFAPNPPFFPVVILASLGAAPDNYAISGVISGTAAVRLVGQLQLSAANTYVGDTFIDAVQDGTDITTSAINGLPATTALFLQPLTSYRNLAAQSLAGLDGMGTVDSAGALTVSPGVGKTSTFEGELGGLGNFTKSGLGTQILNGTYTGSTNVQLDAGTVQIQSNVPRPVSILGAAEVVTEGAISFDSLDASAASGASLVPQGVAGNPFGTISTTVPGTCTFGGGFSLNMDVQGITPGVDLDQLVCDGGFDLGGAQLQLLPDAVSSAAGVPFTLLDGSAALTGTFAGFADGADVPSGVAAAKFQINYGTQDVTLTRRPILNVNALAGYSATVGSSFSATITPSGGVGALADVAAVDQPPWLTAARVGNSLVLSVGSVPAPAGTFSFSIEAEDSIGQRVFQTVSLTVNAAGPDFTWTGSSDENWMNPANWTPAGPPVAGAILRFPSAAANKNILGAPGGSFDYAQLGSDYVISGPGDFTFTNALPILFASGSNSLTHWNTPILFSNANALVALQSVGAATPSLKLGTSVGDLDFSGNLRFNLARSVATDTGSATLLPNFKLNAQSGEVTYATLNGAHTVELRAPANYSGKTTIQGPGLRVLAIDNPSALGTAAAAGATMTDASDAEVIFRNTVSSSEQRVIKENLSFTNSGPVAAGLFAQNAPAARVVFEGAMAFIGSFVSIDAEDGELVLEGTVTGTAQQRFGASGISPGTVRMSGNNSSTGTSEINPGTTVELVVSQALPSGALSMFTGATLRMNGNFAAIGGLSGTGGTIDMTGTVGNASNLNIGGVIADFAGLFTDTPGPMSGDVSFNGSNTTLSGNSTYTGRTFVDGGQVRLSATAALPDVFLTNGGQLVLLATGAQVRTLQPQTTGGIINAGAQRLVISNASSFDANFTLQASLSAAAVGGLNCLASCNLNNAQLQLTEAVPLMLGQTVKVMDGVISGQFANFTNGQIFMIGANTYRFNYSVNAASITRLAPLSTALVVDTLADPAGLPTECSLRQAIQSVVNNQAPPASGCANGATGASISFAPAIVGPSATISLGATLAISRGMQIVGPGPRLLSISGGGTVQIAVVDGPMLEPVRLSGLTLSSGFGVPDMDLLAVRGGAIFNTADLALDEMRFFQNRAVGSAIVPQALGGAISNQGALSVENSLFDGNQVTSTQPSGSVFGGAIHSNQPFGVLNTTFNNNSVSNTSAVPVPGVNSAGGAIYVGMGVATILHSTFTLNAVNGPATGNVSGGAIFAEAMGSLLLSHVAATANAVQSNGATIANLDVDGAGSAEFSLITNLAAGISASNAITGNPQFLPLANNGGLTDTVAFSTGSVLENAGDPAFAAPLTRDQRGIAFPRVARGRIDVGAFEQQLEVLPVSLPDAVVNSPYMQALSATGGQAPYQFTVIGNLPPGASLSASGAFSFLPPSAQSYLFSVLVTDALGQSLERTFTLVANAASIATTTTSTSTLTRPFLVGESYVVQVSLSAVDNTVPTGSVQVSAIRRNPSTAALTCVATLSPGPGNTAIGSCSIVPTTPGVWDLSTVFTGTGNYQNSMFNSVFRLTAPVMVQFLQSLPQTVVGQPFQVQATVVVPSGYPIPRGRVEVRQLPSNAVTVENLDPAGVATLNLISRSGVVKALLVSYVDNVDSVYLNVEFAADHTTLQANTTTSASLSAPQGAAGQAVIVSYTVGIVAPGGIPPGGNGPRGQMEIRDGVDTTTCAVTAASGVCAFTPSTQGTRSIVARYVGDVDYRSSDSAALSYVVQQAGAQADVALTLNNAVRVINGNAVTYTIIIRNLSNSAVGGVRVLNEVPAAASSQSFSCVPGSGSSCGITNGVGRIDQAVDLAANSFVSFRVSVVLPAGEQPVSNTATATLTGGIVDSNPANNSATDVDPRGIMGSGYEDDIPE